MWRSIFALAALTGVVGLEPVTTGLAVGAALVGTVGYGTWCHFKECCSTPWIRYVTRLPVLCKAGFVRYPFFRHNVSLFDEKFDQNVFGQPLVKETVSRALRSHLRRIQTISAADKSGGPQKALVFSFHGWTGSGKNYVSRFIAESMFSQGLASKYVHFFSGPLHFPETQAPEIHQLHVQDIVRTNVSKCSQSLFIFDEVDKMHPKVLDGIKAFIDVHEELDGVDFRQTVFVLLSNSGGSAINQRALSLWQEGVRREDIKLSDLEDIIRLNAFNKQGGLQKSELIVSHLVDYFVPFLPLERPHVKKCAVQELSQQNSFNRTHSLHCDSYDLLADLVVEQMAFMPKDTKIFSETGCKRVHRKVGTIVETILEELESTDDSAHAVAQLGRCRLIKL